MVGRGALACTCSSLAYGPACQLISNAGVSFLGTAIAAEPDPRRPTIARARVYRFQVDEIYKGLDAKTREVVIDPDNITSCQAEYRVGVRYIIFGDKRSGSEMIMAGECSGSRPAETHLDDVKFLGQFAAGNSQTAVSGRVVQGLMTIAWPDADNGAPVSGASVILRNGSAILSQTTDQGGSFRFEPVDPGKYTLLAHADNFGPSGPSPIEVVRGGCVELFPRLVSSTVLSGRVMQMDGAPAVKLSVEVLRKNSAGRWYSSTQFWTQTGEEGQFKFTDLPTGDYLVGYEIWSDKPSPYFPYPTQYFPGVAKREQATVVHLSPNQSMDGLTFRLGRAHTPRTIRVEIVWPDGSSPTEHLLQLFDGRDLIKNIGTTFRDQPPARHQGITEFTGYQERSYKLHARYWIDDLGSAAPTGQQQIAITEVSEVPAGKGVSVRLVLSKRMLASDER